MNAELKQELIDWGVSWEELKERLCGNEELIEKFMFKFLNDQSIEQIRAGIANQDAEEAFQGAHALKGVAGNLSLNGFFPDVAELTEVLRPRQLDGAELLYDKIRLKYDALVEILKKYQTQ